MASGDNGQVDEERQKAIKKFWDLTDRKARAPIGEKIPISEMHNWGQITGAVNKSPTLEKLVNEVGDTLPQHLDYTQLFANITSELGFKTESKEMRLRPEVLKENPNQKLITLSTNNAPTFAFQGFGNSVDEAVEMASKKADPEVTTSLPRKSAS